MYNAERNEIYFPHVIVGNVLGGKEHGYNDIDGGTVPIANVNLNRDKFWGGNCVMLGFIKAYGFYACPHYETRRIMGFYVADASRVTDLGRKLLAKAMPDCKVLFENMAESIHKPLTPEEYAHKLALIEEAKQHGLSPALISTGTIDELEGVIRAVESGRSNVKVELQEPEYSETPVTVRRGRPRKEDE